MAEKKTKAPPATTRDGVSAPTPPTRRDRGGTTPATTRDQTGSGSGSNGGGGDTTVSLTNLPSALAVDYRIVKELGASGAEADLLLVARKDDGTRHVAKIYRRQIQLDKDTIARIQGAREEHVVVIEAAGQSDGRWYELLEYVEAGSLADLIKREGPKVKPRLLQQLVAEMAPAIAHLHGLGVVHRDLKPANVLVRTRSPLDLVLADFGLAAVAEQSIVFMSASRTAAYAAPEAMSGSVSAARDYWSLGMIILEALNGAHPFAGLSQAVIDAQIATRPIDLSKVTDERWLLLCQGLLTRDPDLRWGHDQVQQWLDGDSPAVAFEVAPTPTAKRPYLIGTARAETREELATALSDNWAEARDRIGREKFLPWFEEYWPDTNLAADARRVLEPEGATKGKSLANAEVKLYRLIHLLDPSVAPRFRTITLDQGGLRQLSDRAARGEANWVAAVRALRDLDLLTALGETTPTHLAELANRWSRWRNDIRAAAKSAQSSGAPAVATDVLDQSDIQLFHYAVHDGLVKGLRRKAVAACTEDAADQPWFTTIGDPGTAEVPRLLLLISLAPEAERLTREQRAADEAERQRRLAAELAEARREQAHRRRLVAWGAWGGGFVGAALGLVPAILYGQLRNQVIDHEAVVTGSRAVADSANPAEIIGWMVVSVGLGVLGGLLVASSGPYRTATEERSGGFILLDVTIAGLVMTALGHASRWLLDQRLVAEIFNLASGERAGTFDDDFWSEKANDLYEVLVRSDATVAWLIACSALIALACLVGYLHTSPPPGWARWTALTFALLALFPYLIAPVAVLAVGVAYVVGAVVAIGVTLAIVVAIIAIWADS